VEPVVSVAPPVERAELDACSRPTLSENPRVIIRRGAGPAVALARTDTLVQQSLLERRHPQLGSGRDAAPQPATPAPAPRKTTPR